MPHPVTRTTRVLFVCTHNSARSQMAEGWLRHHSFEHPSAAEGTEEERLAAFRRVRAWVQESFVDYPVAARQ